MHAIVNPTWTALRRLLLIAVTAALLAAGLTPPVASRAAAGLPIEGYLMAEDGAARFVTSNAGAIRTVGVDGVNLTSSGARLTAIPKAAGAIVTAAHRAGLKAELLLGNYSEAIGDFSPKIAGRLLNSAKHRSAVAKALVAKVKKGHYDGVQLDLESLSRAHAAGLTAFVKRLRKVLPAHKTISMAVMASETAGGYGRSGYQLTKLRSVVGRFVLMAYDQHGPTWSSAGPIGGTVWVKQVLAAFIATGVPKSRIDLGVGEYAYTWPADGSEGTVLSLAQARALAGGQATYDATQQEWTATLSNGTVVWWSDATTLAARKQLATAQGIHGLAVWELSLGDPIS